jgi:uncharacterized protein
MSRDSYRQALAEYIEREAQPKEKYGHQPRLYALAVQVGRGMPYDDDVLYAASWLHDIGVFYGHRPEDPEALSRWDNVVYAMEQAPAVLASLSFPADKIAAVLEAIRTHQPTGEPATMEGRILRDADMLEQLGAIGVLRTVCKVGRDTRYATFTEAVATLRQSLQELPGKLQLDTAREMARPKIQILEAFLRAVEQEAQGALF